MPLSWKPLMGLAVLALICWLSLVALGKASSKPALASDPQAQASPTPANHTFLPHIERAATQAARRGF